jgi:hypothetical protein
MTTYLRRRSCASKRTDSSGLHNKSAWRLDGHLPLTTDEVIDHHVDKFYRIYDIAPPPTARQWLGLVFTVGSWLATGHKRLRPRRGLEETELR